MSLKKLYLGGVFIMFTHLHVHSKYSLLDGAIKFPDLVEKLTSLGQTACAITDHGNCYGVIDFYKAMKAANIKPIIGCEVYVAPGSRFDKKKTSERIYNHLVLLAKDNNGYKNLCKIVSAGFTEGFYYHPRVDKEILEKYSEGIVCLSACIAGSIPSAIINNDMEKAQSEIDFFKRIFKDDFYIEVQRHGIKDEEKAYPVLLSLAKKNNIKVVATNDAHYVNKEDADIQDTMLCIQTKSVKSAEKRMRFETDEFYIKSEEEMLNLFPECPEAITNTQEIVDKCNVEFEFGKIKLPYYEIPEGFSDHFAYLKYLTEEGMKERYGNPCKEYIDRMNYELDVINSMGFVGYYLIVWDFIHWAKSHGIAIGPGRGSGAGSIVAYAIGITNLDPMRYNLLFERFLNPERVSMPDFDIDIETVRREEVVDYVTRKYGQPRVSKIITFGTMAAKMSIQDVGKALEIPDAEIRRISALVPLNVTLADALKQIPEFAAEYEKPQSKKIIDTAMKLEGMPRHISSHAAGVLIADKDITEYAPLAVTSKGDVVIQFPMTTLEEIGLVKMDFLGLRTLSVIQNAELAAKKKNPDFCIENIPMDDKATYELLSSGNTDMVFQFESGGMQSILKQLQPTCLEDLIAIISLYRPGPMDSIPEYIKNKHHPESIKYADPKLKDILSVTYGVLVYQEQMMQLFRSLAGFSLGRADIVRRAMAKKKLKIMEEEKKNFLYGLKDENGNVIIEGALARGVSEKVALELTDTMTSFASYAFNKSHAAAYAKVCYQTAYLLTHYPQEYAAAYISSMEDVNKFRKACNVTRGKKIHIKILPPDINKSRASFIAEGENVRYGLGSLANVNYEFMDKAVNEREANGIYESVNDFISRNYTKDLRAPVIESLIKSGAFDNLGYSRASMLASYPNSIETAKARYNVVNNPIQYSVYELLYQSDINTLIATNVDDDDVEKLEDDFNDILEGEFESAKIYFSGHPLSNYKNTIDELGFYTIEALNDIYDSEKLDELPKEVILPVKLSSCKRKMSKNKTPYMTMVIEDLTAPTEVSVFSKALTKYGDKLVDNNILLVKCFIEAGDSGLSFNLNGVYDIPADNDPNNSKKVEALRKSIGKYLLKKKIHTVAVDVEKIAKKPPIVGVLTNEHFKQSSADALIELCSKYPGDSPVVYLSTADKLRKTFELTIRDCPELHKELSDMGLKVVLIDNK